MEPETLPPDAVIRVCLNCGNIWKSREGVARPQCYRCRKTKSREATPEEIAAYGVGITNIHLINPPEDPGTAADPEPEDPGLTDDQMLDPEPGETPTPPEDPAPAAGGGIPPVAIAIGAVLVVGALAGCYFLFIRPQNRDMGDQEPDQVIV